MSFTNPPPLPYTDLPPEATAIGLIGSVLLVAAVAVVISCSIALVLYISGRLDRSVPSHQTQEPQIPAPRTRPTSSNRKAGRS